MPRRSLGLAAVVILSSSFMTGCDRAPAPSPAPVTVAPPQPLPQLTPKEAWENRRSAWLAGDAKAVWGSLCAASRAEKIRTQERAMDEMRMMDDEALARALRPYALEPARFRKMSGEEFCLHMIGGTSQMPPEAKDRLRQQEFVGADIAGSTAVCTVASTDGSRDLLVLVAEDGAWKVDDAETARRRGKPSRR